MNLSIEKNLFFSFVVLNERKELYITNNVPFFLVFFSICIWFSPSREQVNKRDILDDNDDDNNDVIA